ncbi:ATP-binding protein [Granulicella cerasi]|uniref:histidine kinase n=1 Tax=Granulicella cerasi TaxID=741063 RepID=A0ABW1Z8K1_9BACT|nr:ATP-binding protein [Granulicella cerasi]
MLIIEDYEEDALLLARHLTRGGYKLDWRRIETAIDLKAALDEAEPWDLIIADYTLPSFGARDALALLQQTGLDIPFIIVSGTVDEVSAVNAMRAGAHDYVLKGHLERLMPAIERELADSARRKERLATELELKLAQQRFSATFNQAAVGMAHTTTDGNFLLANRRLADLLMVDPSGFRGLILGDFILPSDRVTKRALLNEMLEGKRSGFRIEVTLLRTDGATFPAQLTVSALTYDDRGESTLLWVIEDISARKAAERETSELMTRLINSERLAAAGRMANTLAHEINNPLEALTNIVYLLQTQTLSSQAIELLDVAARELERVGHITRSTLSFYRKVPGRTLDLHAILDEVLQLFASRAQQHGVELLPRYNDSIRIVRYDPSLRQVFANVVGNALEAMEQSGGRIYIRGRVSGDHVTVTVADNGHGIEREHMRAVFEPFFTTKGEKGTGLGLWVTRGIVEEQGGVLQLRSCTHGPKHGTTIRIRLPIESRDNVPTAIVQ